MSMWLSLAKIEPSLLTTAREKPELIDSLFFDEDDDPGAPVPGFRPVADAYGYDYRLLSDIAEGRAQAEENTTDWMGAYPWLAKASGHGCDVTEEYEFCYGPAFVLTPDEVRQVAEGLVAEGWVPSTAAKWDEETEDDEFEDLGPFFAAAAAEGKAVIGGVN
ncbi:hypothetical protein [Streptomyces sp. NPDC096132]|uniref:hypothetical protein n=1 Tax=Streptomyces sp. NPDC096132 TaxID=3366075 RepID=UPI0037FF17B7